MRPFPFCTVVCVSNIFPSTQTRVKHLQVIISGKHQQAGTCFRSPTKSQGTGRLAWPWVSSSLNKCNMDQPQHHACLTQCLLKDCSVQINYRALRAYETSLLFFRKTIWGWSSTAIACMCAIGPSKRAMWEGKEKTEHRITPNPPPLVFVMAKGLCAFLLACEWEKQCCPAQATHYTSGGTEKSAWKEEGRVVFMSLTSLWVPFL